MVLTIVVILIIVIIFLTFKNDVESFLEYLDNVLSGKKPITSSINNLSLINDPKSPMYKWNLTEDFDVNNYLIIPWKEVFKCQLSDVNLESLDDNPKVDLIIIAKEQYNIDLEMTNIIIVEYRSPQETWDNLAGRGGLLFILKKEKKQLFYYQTIMS